MMRLLMVILWPSFLVAIAAEGLFFSCFDPAELMFAGSRPDLPPLAVYTLGFFGFWIFCALASMLTLYLANVPNDHKVRI